MIHHLLNIKNIASNFLLARGKSLVIVIPYIWLLLFFIIPFLLVIRISFSETIFAIPPITPIIEWTSDMMLRLNFNLSNYHEIATDQLFLDTILSSLGVSTFTTLVCLVLGYSMAYAIVSVSSRWRLLLFLLLMLPFWTSFLIRVYAWVGLLSNTGIINSILMRLYIIKSPINMLYTNFSLILGLVYCYLPFMILPIYVSLEKIKPEYKEASFDLGAKPWTTFWRVTVPLSRPGIISGSILVFIPVVGEYVIPELLGSADTLMIGRVMWMEFFNNRDWPLACSLAVIMLIIFTVPIMIFQRTQTRQQIFQEDEYAK